jgi:hypothetical protein
MVADKVYQIRHGVKHHFRRKAVEFGTVSGEVGV